MRYLVKKRKIDENTTEKYMIPCAEPPEGKEVSSKLEKLDNLKKQYPAKDMVNNSERTKIQEEVARKERKLKKNKP